MPTNYADTAQRIVRYYPAVVERLTCNLQLKLSGSWKNTRLLSVWYYGHQPELSKLQYLTKEMVAIDEKELAPPFFIVTDSPENIAMRIHMKEAEDRLFRCNVTSVTVRLLSIKTFLWVAKRKEWIHSQLNIDFENDKKSLWTIDTYHSKSGLLLRDKRLTHDRLIGWDFNTWAPLKEYFDEVKIRCLQRYLEEYGNS